MTSVKKYRTLIVDDEEPARIRLIQLLSPYQEMISIVGEAVNGIEAVEMINFLKPDIVFLDIRMPGKDGFEVIQCLQNVPYLIFCTAFDHYALQAFETNSIDYIVKPVKPERLAITLGKVKNLNRNNDYSQVLHWVEETMALRKRETVTSFPVKVGDRVIFIKTDDISYFEANEKYVELNNRQGKKHILDQSLSYLEGKLPGHFLRVHRSIIVNTLLINEIRRYMGSKYTIILNDMPQSHLVSGRAYSEKVKELLDV
jgi:two-component system, LytTR family, response regulator